LSDALTDIRRDEERAELLRCIYRLEREFLAAPDREKAGELERLWAAYARQPHGYWGGPNSVKAYERVAYFHDWQPEDGTRWLAEFYGEGIAVRTGASFLMDRDVFEEMFARIVFEQKCGPFAHSVFRVKVKMEVERLTCRSCPKFSELCGTVACYSKVERELEERWRKADYGRALVEHGAGG